MTSLIIFILILSLLVMIHEFGHFYAAKKSGVRVEEFGFGLPPRVFGKKFGETLYSLNWLPFGGFVRLTGEDSVDLESYEAQKSDPRNFNSKSANIRIIIVLAGIIMNLFLAVTLYYIFFFGTGFKSFNLPVLFDYDFRFGQKEEIGTVIVGVEESMPAEQAGIILGEAVTAVNGNEVNDREDLRTILTPLVGQEVTLELRDIRSTQDKVREVQIVPVQNEEGIGVLGVYLSSAVQLNYENTKLTSGFLHAANMIEYSVTTLYELFALSFSERTVEPVSSSVAGPIGIFSIVDGILDYGSTEATQAARIKTSVLGIIDLTALLSVSLAFMNFLPLPALDGGRLAFLVLEKIRGKPVNPKYEIAIHQVGMLLLLSLLILVSIRDVARLF